jgi:hypothetical protein
MKSKTSMVVACFLVYISAGRLLLPRNVGSPKCSAGGSGVQFFHFSANIFNRSVCPKKLHHCD